MADETREWPSTNECAKADGSQPAEPIRDSGLCAATKVRMYGCNRNLLASSREEKPRKVGGVHVRPLPCGEADNRVSATTDALGAGPGVARGAALLRLLRSNVSSDPHSHCGFHPMRASLVAISDAQAYKQPSGVLMRAWRPD